MPGVVDARHHNFALGGMCRSYRITKTNLNNLADWLWSHPSSLGDLTTVVQYPINAIISLNYVPFSPDVESSTAVPVHIGNIGISEVRGCRLNDGDTKIVYGTGTSYPITRHFNNYLDFAPYTKISVFVPFCGSISLDPSKVYGKSLGIQYNINPITGDFSAQIYTISGGTNTLINTQFGNCAASVPLTGADYTGARAQTVNGLMQAISGGVQVAGSITTIGMTLAGGAVGGIPGGVAAAGAAAAGISGISNLVKGIDTVETAKPEYRVQGAAVGNSCLLSNVVPYVEIVRVKRVKPSATDPVTSTVWEQATYEGQPSFEIVKLSSLNGLGFTRIKDIHLDGMSATDTEKQELEMLLKKGVIF